MTPRVIEGNAPQGRRLVAGVCTTMSLVVVSPGLAAYYPPPSDGPDARERHVASKRTTT